MKTCTECGVTKPLERFHHHAGMADGHYNQCRLCMYTNQQARRQSEQKRRNEPNEISVLMESWGRCG